MTSCEAIGTQENMNLEGIFIWTNQSTKLLLQKYLERKSKFCDPKIKKKLLWTEIVEEFKIKGYNVSEDILDRKMRNLKQSYKNIKENNRKTSTGLDRITWKWYDTMESLFKEDRNICPAKQATTKSAHRLEKAESMDLAVERRDLISAANKIFGEGKWNHSVVSQTLDFVELIGAKYSAGCVSFVKVLLEDGNFHEDIGYYTSEEATKGLSIHNARIGSAVNALKRVFLSFGEKFERELQRQINSEQASDVQKDVTQLLDKQTSKPNVSVNTYCGTISLITSHDSCANPTYVTLERSIGEQVTNIHSVPVIAVNNGITDSETNPSSSINVESIKIEPLSNKSISTNEQKSKALSTNEMLRIERKRKQKEKQMEFKKRMMEKEELMSTSNNISDKPNSRY